MRALRLLLAFVAFAPLAAGQSFNIDVGDNLILFPAPQSTYGGAAGQTGTWNAVKFPYSAALVGLDGSPTSATTTSTSSYSYNYFPSTLTRDDRNLMIDIQNLPWLGGPWSWTFDGLQNGDYALTTYAWAPEDNGNLTRVHVPLSTDPPQDVGGLWSGSPHVFGVTYALHHLTVTSGTFTLQVEGLNGHDGSVNGFQLVFLPPATTYCTAKVNSAGCTPSIGFSGIPSMSSGSGFSITASQVLENKFGLFFYSLNGQASTPFQGGTLCVKAPIVRTPLQGSGGSGACGGSFAFDFNAWIAAGGDPALAAGARVNGQYWYRDPADPFTTGLSDGIEFQIQP